MHKPIMLLLLTGLTLFMGVRPAAAAPVTPSVCDAVTGNLVANCGFENGSLNDWGLSGADYSLTDPTSVHSGSFGLSLYGYQQELAHPIATTIGDSYTLSFYLSSAVGYSISFGVNWGASILYPYSTLAPPTSYTKWTYTGLSAVSSSTLLALTTKGAVNGHPTYLDDFSVVDTGSVVPTPPSSSVPEPPTFWLFSAGLLGLAWLARKKYQDDGLGKRGQGSSAPHRAGGTRIGSRDYTPPKTR